MRGIPAIFEWGMLWMCRHFVVVVVVVVGIKKNCVLLYKMVVFGVQQVLQVQHMAVDSIWLDRVSGRAG